jgi:hypothetical protein
MSFLSNLISPKLGVKLIRAQLEKQFNVKIAVFDIIFVVATNRMSVVINSTFYPFAADQLKDIILKYGKKHLKAFQQMDVVSMQVTEQDEVNIVLCYTEGIEKKKLTYKL